MPPRHSKPSPIACAGCGPSAPGTQRTIQRTSSSSSQTNVHLPLQLRPCPSTSVRPGAALIKADELQSSTQFATRSPRSLSASHAGAAGASPLGLGCPSPASLHHSPLSAPLDLKRRRGRGRPPSELCSTPPASLLQAPTRPPPRPLEPLRPLSPPIPARPTRPVLASSPPYLRRPKPLAVRLSRPDSLHPCRACPLPLMHISAKTRPFDGSLLLPTRKRFTHRSRHTPRASTPRLPPSRPSAPTSDRRLAHRDHPVKPSRPTSLGTSPRRGSASPPMPLPRRTEPLVSRQIPRLRRSPRCLRPSSRTVS